MTVETFRLSEEFAKKETSLGIMENQLRQFAKQDTGLSQKVIDLRKQIKKSRDELKKMQIQKMQIDEVKSQIIEDIRNFDTVEKRRHNVALETEQSLNEAKDRIKELEKELRFVNSNRRDLELALGGVQEQNN